MWTIFKTFIKFVTKLLPFYVLVFGCKTCGILAPQPGIDPTAPAVEVQSLNHRTTRTVPKLKFLKS